MRDGGSEQAVCDANQAIRDYLRGLPGYAPTTAEERAEYDRLVDAYMAAVREMHAAPRSQQIAA